MFTCIYVYVWLRVYTCGHTCSSACTFWRHPCGGLQGYGRTHCVIPTLVLYSNKRTPQVFQRQVLKAKAFFLGPFRVHKAIFHIHKEGSDLLTTVDRPQNSNNGHLRLGSIAQTDRDRVSCKAKHK